MTRRRSSRSRTLLEIRAPRKGTVIIAAVLYIVGLFGALGWWPVPQPLAIAALAIAGGLLLLGVLLRGL
jgi:hypothetical protein